MWCSFLHVCPPPFLHSVSAADRYFGGQYYAINYAGTNKAYLFSEVYPSLLVGVSSYSHSRTGITRFSTGQLQQQCMFPLLPLLPPHVFILVLHRMISVVGFLDSIVAAKQNSAKFGYSISPNRELVALGAANLGASFVPGTLPAYGSITRCVIVSLC